jgi:hypothetical protein
MGAYTGFVTVNSSPEAATNSLLMKRPVGWSYFLPLGNVICVVDAIVGDVRERGREDEKLGEVREA